MNEMMQTFYLMWGNGPLATNHEVFVSSYEVTLDRYVLVDWCCGDRLLHLHAQDLERRVMLHLKFRTTREADKWLTAQSARPWRL